MDSFPTLNSTRLFNPCKQSFWVVYRNHHICPSVSTSVHIFCKCNSLIDEPILLKLYTVAVYNLGMCMIEDKPSTNYFKGDNW